MANVGSWQPDRFDTIHYIHKLAEARVGEGYSVISGCDVHENGTPDMDVVVDSGEIFYGDVYKTVAGNNVTISAADGTNDRIDVIYVDSSGVAQVHTGDALPVSDPLGNTVWTQYESPYPKTGCPAGVIIALVYVPANDTSIENAQIEDIAQYNLIEGITTLNDNVTQADGKYIATDKIRARDDDGLQLQDDEGNGITIASGGLITLAGHHLTPAASSNMFFGMHTGYNNTTGSENSFFGQGAGYNNTTGNFNSFFGMYTGYNNTEGSENSFFGRRAGFSNTTGNFNSFFGMHAGSANTTGSENSFFGQSAGFSNTTGNFNSFFGQSAGYNNTTGTNLTCIGYNAQASTAGATNEVTLGNANVTTLRCRTQTITALSDRRDKTAIEPIPLGLDFIRDLKPSKWVWNCRDGSRIGDEDTGFVAQDLDDSQKKFGYEIPGLVFKPNDDRWEASSGKFLTVAIKAIQELAAKVDMLEAQIDA